MAGRMRGRKASRVTRSTFIVEEVFEEELEVHETVEIRLAREVDEDIHIALRPGCSMDDRAKEHEPLDAEPVLYRNKVRFQQFYDPVLFHMMKIVQIGPKNQGGKLQRSFHHPAGQIKEERRVGREDDDRCDIGNLPTGKSAEQDARVGKRINQDHALERLR